MPDYRNEWGRFLAAQGRYAALDSAVQAGGFPSPMMPRWLLIAPLLAEVGDSGSLDGFGCHFEVRLSKTSLDPILWLEGSRPLRS